MMQKIWLLLFIAWGLPLTFYRSRFRKIVYQTDSWLINIKPLFWKELKALFGDLYPGNREYHKFRNFYRMYLVIYLVLFVSYIFLKPEQPMKRIEVGSTLPSFTLKDQNGNLFSMDSVLGRKNLVIYFYPKDDSPGCTKQACSFRDQFEVFSEADAMIIGISGQSVESHRKFAEKHRLSYILLSDEGNKVRKLFGVPTNFLGLLPGRVTYVADKAGKVVFVFDSQTRTQDHVENALKILQGLR